MAAMPAADINITVRLPRRETAVPLLLKEQRWLPLYASATSVPVPVPVLVGTPGLPRRELLSALWTELIAVPDWAGPALWLHGDLHPDNILQHGGALSAVLDFGDLCGGDPATDLATAWMTFDAPGRELFRTEVDRLSGTDPDTWRRALGWALNMGSALLAHSDDNPPLRAMAAHTLKQVLLDAG